MTIVENTPAAWDGRASTTATSWAAAMWSQHGQTQRFLAVLRHLDLRHGDAVLDVGCGTGRLNEFLPPDVDYLAFDTSPRMRDRCALEHPAAVMLDRLPRVAVEHVVAVGPFNLADRWSVDHTRRELEGLWRITLQTLVVSVYRGHDRACIHYTPELVARWASELSERFTVEAHMPNDLLMAVRRCG